MESSVNSSHAVTLSPGADLDAECFGQCLALVRA